MDKQANTAKQTMHIGVLGDTHGHFALALGLLKRWERENKSLDMILQVGDFSVWPPPFKLDKATARFAEEDPDEISFVRYLDKTEESERFFSPDSPDYISCPVIFIKGNHEDFEYLDEVARHEREFPIPLGYHERFHYLPNGEIAVIKKGNSTLKIGGMGGMEWARIGEDSRYRITNREVRKLEAQGSLDILLGHEPYQSGLDGHIGSRILKELVRSLKPAYFLCGHCHVPGQELNPVGKTRGYILNAVNFRGKRRLNPGCVGILRWHSSTQNSFHFLEEEVTWISEYTRFNFRYLGAELHVGDGK